MSAANVVVYNPGKAPQSTAQYRVEELSRIRGIYRLHVIGPAGVDEYMIQTGAALNTYLLLPTACIVEKIAWTHTEADNLTLSTDAITITVDAYDYNGRRVAPLRWYAYTGAASSGIQGYTWYEPPNEWRIQTNTTAGHRVMMYIDIVVAGDPR